jgi:REP element-mobilizing transposase RayT
MTKILAVKYPSSTDRVRPNSDHLHTVIDVPDVSKIKELFGSLLFRDSELYRYNYCLVKHEGKMYVIEPTDIEKRLYSRKSVDYHPLCDMI